MDDDFEEEFTSRTALDPEMSEEIRRRVFDEPGCLKLTLIRHQGIGAPKESLKPISLHGELIWQAEQTDGKHVTVKNYEQGEPASGALESLLSATGAREYHLTATTGDLHVRITRKGRMLVSRGKPADSNAAPPSVRPHDHAKDQPLNRFDSVPLLKVLGMADASGSVKASMRGKTDQINSFLRELDTLLDESKRQAGGTFNIVDCGCGRAYLTLSAYCYLSGKGMHVKVVGIDRNDDLMKKATAMAKALDVDADVCFKTADLADCDPGFKPDLILSLHACDTATDLAIANGIKWGAEMMLVAPCCQHDLQGQMKDSGPMRALLRHGILRERLADLLTDSFRAQIMRILGYRVRVLEFVSQEATARNIMLRAQFGVKKYQPATIDEYLDMRDMWHVTPVIETLLAEKLKCLSGEV